jgi:uncharacterized protein YceK
MKTIRANEFIVCVAAIILAGCATHAEVVRSDSGTSAYFAAANQSQNSQNDVGWTLHLPSDNP